MLAGKVVAELVDALGFDPVEAGPLIRSAALQPGSAVFGHHLDTDAMRQALELEERAA